MIENENYKGFWFLPENTEKKIPGILYYEVNKEIRLELIGGFDVTPQDMFSSDSQSMKIIYGITSNNEKITLFRCFRSGSWNSSSPYPITNYRCYYFFKGQHINNISSEVFNKIQVEFSSLYEWCPSNGISHSITFSEDNENEITGTSFGLSKKDLWEKSVQIDSDFTLRIYTDAEVKNRSDREYNLIQNTILEIECHTSKKTFSDFLNRVEIFRQFLSLATLSPINLLKTTFFDNDSFQELNNGRRDIDSVPLYFIKDREETVGRQTHEFLFKYQDIADVFPEIINKWYSCGKSLTPIRNHLMLSLEPKKKFTSLDFLIIVQALEGYHRRFISEKRDDSLKLRNRLEGLIHLFKDVNKVSNSQIIIDQVVKSRNYYSHFFDKNNDVLEGVKLYELTNQLRFLLICCVLHLIGFNVEEMNKLLN